MHVYRKVDGVDNRWLSTGRERGEGGITVGLPRESCGEGAGDRGPRKLDRPALLANASGIIQYCGTRPP